MIRKISTGIDWLLVLFMLPIIAGGLVTMKSFNVLENAGSFFDKQVLWVLIGFLVFFVFSSLDFRFLKRTDILLFIFLLNSGILLLLFILGHVSHGAKSWFNFGYFSFQPVDTMKLVLVLILAKYFSLRHVEIGDIKHIFISGFYAFLPFILVLFQPDFGSAMIIFLIWLGMVMVSGISKTHLALVFSMGVLLFVSFWILLQIDRKRRKISHGTD
jgi:rod shape determining protein RodA